LAVSGAYTGSATVLVDEFNAGGLQGGSKRRLIRGRDRNFSLDRFHPSNGGYSHLHFLFNQSIAGFDIIAD